MGWYNKGLNIDPSLVSMTGGIGKGMAAFGDSLVNLGDQKIKKAKEDAANKEKAAKKRSLARGLNVKNRVLNPDAVGKLAKSYGIDKNSPLYKLGAPSQFNADLGLADFGKADKKKDPEVFGMKQNANGDWVTIYKDGSIGPNKIQGIHPTTTVATGGNLVDKVTKKSIFTAPKKQTEKKAPTLSQLGKLKFEQSKYAEGSPNYKTYQKRIDMLTTKKPTTSQTVSMMAKLIREQKQYPVGSKLYKRYEQRITNVAKGNGNGLNDAIAKLLTGNTGANPTNTATTNPPQSKKEKRIDPLGLGL